MIGRFGTVPPHATGCLSTCALSAQHAAAGKTNRQIAQELFLTMKTVAFPLTNAYRKLDVTSRDELGAALSASD